MNTIEAHLWEQATPARDFGDAPGVMKAGFVCSRCRKMQMLRVLNMYDQVPDWRKEFWNGMQVVPCKGANMAKVEYVPKTLIENKLLAALEEPGNVAIVVNEYELKLIIDGLGELGTGPHVAGLIADLEKLLAGAFPK